MSGFKKNIVKLVSGTFFSQVVLLVSTPFLTRLYSTEDFGLLSLFVSVLGVSSVSASLRYNRAIPLPKDELSAIRILTLGGMITLVSSLISLLIILFFKFGYFQSDTNFDDIFLVIPIAILSVGLYDILNYWCIRTNKFGVIAKSKVIQAVVTASIQLSMFSFGAFSLVVGHTLGLVVALLFFLVVLKVQLNFDWAEIRLEAKRYKDFPKYSTFEALLNSFGNNSPILLVTLFFGQSFAGMYALTYKVLSLPMNLIGAAVGQAYFSKAAKLYETDKVGNFTLDLFRVLLSIGMPFAIMLFLSAPFIFDMVFGKDWADAGYFARYMTPWLLLVFISSPLSSIIAIAEKQKESLIFQSAFLFVKVAVIYLSSQLGNAFITVVLLSIFSSVMLVMFIVWLLSLSGCNILEAKYDIMQVTFVSFFCNIPILFWFFSGYEYVGNYYFIFPLVASLIMTIVWLKKVRVKYASF
ncbi:putative Polysaccharide biosynthesis protein [Vibrio coralliirubri]|uniref:lipopolysaccharide biosynthesis protein n=1 Tax=Vibrio TaxID=662 RepID=UPI000633FBE4|nr:MULTISPECIES: oligosaccharide flippase family protein [Vibrio]PQJ57815.1 hypothetical protein BTO12_09975 [Vibrio splendidus]CDT25045.1 putative Polysaccharide biosynthesis protein [Vibrio coralliirubri]